MRTLRVVLVLEVEAPGYRGGRGGVHRGQGGSSLGGHGGGERRRRFGDSRRRKVGGPRRGTAQRRVRLNPGVLLTAYESLEGESLGKLHGPGHLDHAHGERRRRLFVRTRVFIVGFTAAADRLRPPRLPHVPEPLEVHNEHPRQPHDLPREHRVCPVASALLALAFQRLGREEPGQQRGEIRGRSPVLGELDGEVAERLVARALVPARLARQRRGHRGGEVPARGAQGPVQRHDLVDVSGCLRARDPFLDESASVVRGCHLLLEGVQALAQELVRVVLLVTHVVRVPALHRGLHLRG